LLRLRVSRCQLNEDGTLDLENSEPEEAARVNHILVQGGLQVYSIENRRDRLEELFMQLTGEE
jgi:hypothetical protein